MLHLLDNLTTLPTCITWVVPLQGSIHVMHSVRIGGKINWQEKHFPFKEAFNALQSITKTKS